MDPATAYAAGSLAVSAVSVGSSILGGKSAKKAAKKAAKEQAALTYAGRQEEIRQKRRAARHQVGDARARVGASNLLMSGSPKAYVEELNMENMREISYARGAAEKERQAIKAGARGAGDSLFYKAAGDAIGLGAQSLANYFSQPAAAAPATTNTAATNQAGGFYGTGLE